MGTGERPALADKAEVTAAPGAGETEPAGTPVDRPVATAGEANFSPGRKTLVVTAGCGADGDGDVPAKLPAGGWIGEDATGAAVGAATIGLAATAGGEALVVTADG